MPCRGSPRPLGLRRADHIPSAFQISAFCTVIVRELSNPRRFRRGGSWLVQFFTCKGQPSQISDLIKACVLTTRWVFERPRAFDSVPNCQPLHLNPRFLIMLMYLGELSPDVLEVLICTLARFFSFAVDFHPESQSINKTTHASSYTLSAEVLTKCSLSKHMQAMHAYLLAVIATRLGEGEACKYLFLMASIYASIISRSSTLCSSLFRGNFLRAVACHRDRFKHDLNRQQLQLCRAVKANEVTWGDVDRALEALGQVPHLWPTLSEQMAQWQGAGLLLMAIGMPHWEGRKSGGRSVNRGESFSRK